MSLENLLSPKNDRNTKHSGSLKDLLNKIKQLHKNNEVLFSNINDVQSYQLGQGSYGAIFKTKTNRQYIIKFASESDYTIRQEDFSKLIKDKFENVVKVYSVFDMSNSNMIVLDDGDEVDYLVVMEKLEPLHSDYTYTKVTDMRNVIEWAYMISSVWEDVTNVPKMERLEELLNNPRIKSSLSKQEYGRVQYLYLHDREGRKVFEDVLNGIIELYEHFNGFFYKDIHSGNIMYDPKKKQYKLVDVI